MHMSFCRTHVPHAQQQMHSKQMVQTLLLACNPSAALCMLRVQTKFLIVSRTPEKCCALPCTMHTLWVYIAVFLAQVLEAILDDDQDMQDMYLARRAEMADMIAPDPDNPPDDSTDPALALLPSVFSSSIAETALTQALQHVASSQEQQPASPQYLVSKHAGQSWLNQRSDQDQQQDVEDELSPWASQHPLEMAVPDQASFLSLEYIKAHCRFTHATMGQTTMRIYLLVFLPFLQSILTLSQAIWKPFDLFQKGPFP